MSGDLNSPDRPDIPVIPEIYCSHVRLPLHFPSTAACFSDDFNAGTLETT